MSKKRKTPSKSSKKSKKPNKDKGIGDKRCSKEVINKGRMMKGSGALVVIFTLLIFGIYFLFKILEHLGINTNMILIMSIILILGLLMYGVGRMYLISNDCYGEL